MRNARACEACRASKNRCFFANDNTICQRCEQTKNRCTIREKARPRRARRAARLENTTNLDDSPPLATSLTSPPTKNPPKGGEFSLDLPTTVYHDPAKDAESFRDHHNQVFKEDDSRSFTPPKETSSSLPVPPKYIPGRKLTLSQATHLLNLYIPKLAFFPFVTLPANPTVPALSQQSPFLLLAILTVAAIPHPFLHHQLDQEFRRVLSLKLIVDSQKSLDYLLGLLVYVAWYPTHTNPKSNPCFTYMNLANSLALDLGLDQAQTQNSLFREYDPKGLVDSNGGWTMEARRAYMGCYVLGSHLSKGFAKPQTMSYENLLSSNPGTFVPSHTTTQATAIVILERIWDRIYDAWTAKNYPQMDVFSTELYVQLFNAELDNWKRNVPESIANSPLLALYHKHTHLSVYAHALRLLRRPYRPFVPGTAEVIPSPDHLHTCLRLGASYLQHLLSLPTQDYTHFATIHWSQLIHSLVALVRLTFLIAHVENWSAETTREKVGLSMYLEALCFRFGSLSSIPQSSSEAGLESNESEKSGMNGNKPKRKHFDKYFIMHSMLSTLKKTWERRVEAIAPKTSTISKGKCPIFASEMAPVLENSSLNFNFDDMGAWDGGFADGAVGWNTSMSGMGTNNSYGDACLKTLADSSAVCSVATGENGRMSAVDMTAGKMVRHENEATMYDDLWATMTCSWAEQASGWPIPVEQGAVISDIGGNLNGSMWGYQVNNT